jgi:hypothetical protein
MDDKQLFAKLRHIFMIEDGITEARANVCYSDQRLAMARDTDPTTFSTWVERLTNVDVLPV